MSARVFFRRTVMNGRFVPNFDRVTVCCTAEIARYSYISKRRAARPIVDDILAAPPITRRLSW